MDTDVGFRCLMNPVVIPALILILKAVGTEAQADECVDTESSCSGWADLGECEVNPAYMDVKCPHSCNKCPPARCSEANGFFELESSKGCFKFINKTATWEEASSVCQNEGLVMALPDKQSAATLREQLLNKYGDHRPVWLDGRYNNNINGYEAQHRHRGSVDTLSLNDDLWYPGEPAPYVTSNYCLTLVVHKLALEHHPNQPYIPRPCNGHGHYALCQGCTHGTHGSFSIGSSECFKMFRNVEQTWEEAQAHCASEGLKLAKPSQDITLQLRKHLFDTYGDHASVWLNAVGNGRTFVWQEDGTDLSNDDKLWWPGRPVNSKSSDETDFCLFLIVNLHNRDEYPSNPYATHPCSSSFNILCQDVSHTKTIPPNTQMNVAVPGTPGPIVAGANNQKNCLGSCVPINECPSLSNILREAQQGNSDATQKLRNSVCSQTNGGLNVCCQPESISNGFPDYCGGLNKTEHIVVGEKAALKQWPWMALLKASAGEFERWVCGGVLISARYVLTAAHCVAHSAYNVDFVRLGELVINQNPDSSIAPQPQDIQIEKLITHPEYKSPCSKCNDIALIKLARPARVDREFVEPICISRSPSREIDNSVNGWVAGWGLSTQNPYVFSQTNHLQQLNVPIQELKFCRDRKQGQSYPDPAMVFCAGGEMGKDTCRSDSGGPLMVSTKDHVWYTIGVVSFGNTICGAEGSQTVFTNIRYYLPWIENTILQ